MLLNLLTAAAEAPTISSMLTDMGMVFTSVIGWCVEVGSTIVSTPFLFILVAIPVSLVAIGVFRRLTRIR